MRLIHLIFSLYVLLLAFVPCQDNFSLVANGAAGSVHAEHPDHDHPESDHEDHCTPFCICACCGAVLDAPPALLAFTVTQPLPPKGSTQPTTTQNWNPGTFAASSWQPPRA
ncbi:DUF6660 family protein [Neolewinella antarctica]|uniref:DUF2946 domain-containing protein n=1 Tax=Neolewinella antarctica TaxID=442734 RepID=A0ABX0XGS0_9BACT|nr:DUF6660 family protein [Neolewinella antarctica]NJC28340.1 hypothetical protein [Neolewinella antarctica]